MSNFDPHRRVPCCLLVVYGALAAGCFPDPPPPVMSSGTTGTSGSGSGGEASVGTSATSSASTTAGTTSPMPDVGAASTGFVTTGGTTTGTPVDCDLDGDFGTPTPLVELNDPDYNEERAWLSDDERTIYFSTSRDSGYNIYVATRRDPRGMFGGTQQLFGVAMIEEASPALTSDGMTMIYAESPIGADTYDLMVATRTETGGPFTAMLLATVSDPNFNDGAPWVDEDASVLYFETNRDGTLDIYRSVSDGNTFGTPEPVGALNTASADGSPVLHPNLGLVYFASNRGGTLGDDDVWVATVSKDGNTFGPANNVTAVNSAEADAPSWISPDGCRLYLASRRDGFLDLYVAEKE
jgi:Tol biopolymer transport system component